MSFHVFHQPTPNVAHGKKNECAGVVFHHTAGAFRGAVAWLCNPEAKASAHVVIAKDGTQAVLANDVAVTWHAGRSFFKGRSGCNRFMLGVEFELLDAEELLTDAQIASALAWLSGRWERYGWTLSDMTHHRDISPGRKIDLNPTNWKRLRQAIAEAFAQDR